MGRLSVSAKSEGAESSAPSIFKRFFIKTYIHSFVNFSFDLLGSFVGSLFIISLIILCFYFSYVCSYFIFHLVKEAITSSKK